MIAHEFLDLYKTLEETLEERYSRENRRYSSVIMEFMNSSEGEEWREKMDMCREIRNLMSHTPDVNGEPVVTPAQGVIDTLRNILEYVQKPPLAVDYATPTDRLLKTALDARALPLMRAMSQRGFSHVPVMNEGRMIGVFSVSTVFANAILRATALNEETRVGAFEDILPMDRHTTEQFEFIGETITLPEARAAFNMGRERRRRMAALFVTASGRPDEKLVGMITPWDVLKGKQTER